MKKRENHIFGVKFNNFNMQEAISEIDKLIANNKLHKKKSYIVTPNIDHLVNIYRNSKFRMVYDNAEMKLVDGMPIVKLAKFFKKPFKEKISGADLTPKLFDLAYNKKYKIFILGSSNEVGKKVKEIYKQKFASDFQIEVYSPPFGFEKNEQEVKLSLNHINRFSPDVLFVALGSPKGEIFIYDNIDNINVPVSIQIGASIDFMTGSIKRAPKWMQNCSLEWFYRFLQEPKRMFRRYFINDIYFLKIIFLEIKNIVAKKVG